MRNASESVTFCYEYRTCHRLRSARLVIAGRMLPTSSILCRRQISRGNFAIGGLDRPGSNPIRFFGRSKVQGRANAYAKSILTLIRAMSTILTDSCLGTSRVRIRDPENYEFRVNPVTSTRNRCNIARYKSAKCRRHGFSNDRNTNVRQSERSNRPSRGEQETK